MFEIIPRVIVDTVRAVPDTAQLPSNDVVRDVLADAIYQVNSGWGVGAAGGTLVRLAMQLSRESEAFDEAVRKVAAADAAALDLHKQLKVEQLNRGKLQKQLDEALKRERAVYVVGRSDHDE